MKLKSILILIIGLSINISAQKLVGIGLDIGENLMPIALKYKGITGAIVFKTVAEKGRLFDYKIGYGNFKGSERIPKLSENHIQHIYGFYFSISHKFSRHFGWNLNFATQNISTTFNYFDSDFNTKYSIKSNSEILYALGYNIYYENKIKLNKNLIIYPTLTIGIARNTKPIYSNTPVYIPGNNFNVGPLRLNASFPLIYNFKK